MRGALPFQRARLFGAQQLKLIFSFFHNAHGGAHPDQYTRGGQREKPPSLPETHHHEIIERSRNGHVTEDPAVPVMLIIIVGARVVTQPDLIERGVRPELGRDIFGLIFLGRPATEIRVQPHGHQIVPSGTYWTLKTMVRAMP